VRIAAPVAREYRALLDAFFTRPASIEILLHLEPAARFNEIKLRIPGLSSKTLAASLRFLSDQGMVLPEPIPGARPRSLYRLTAKGQELAAILRAVTEVVAGPRESPVGGPSHQPQLGPTHPGEPVAGHGK
jgi:DNA-binding HxlR family transcriptional regulator